jgi:hypothetical protein
MSKVLVFHTMTCQAWNFNLSHSDPAQPPLLALVAALIDDNGELGRMTRIIQLPEGEQISARAYADSGINDDMMREHGVPLCEAIREFAALAELADYVAAYSVDHHASVVLRSARECDIDLPTAAVYCLMREATIPCKIPSRSPNTFKLPKLAEAYAHFAQKELEMPYDGTALEILDWHLRVRNLIYRGIKLHEARELQREAKPLAKVRTSAR